jgi:hypothetical protein
MIGWFSANGLALNMEKMNIMKFTWTKDDLESGKMHVYYSYQYNGFYRIWYEQHVTGELFNSLSITLPIWQPHKHTR